MMKMMSCLLLLGVCLLAAAEEECFDKEAIMKEYKAHEEQCKTLTKDTKDKMEMISCILGKYDAMTDGKVDYEKFKGVALKKVDKSETKKKAIGVGMDACKTKHADLNGHDFWHCVGETFKKECNIQC